MTHFVCIPYGSETQIAKVLIVQFDEVIYDQSRNNFGIP